VGLGGSDYWEVVADVAFDYLDASGVFISSFAYSASLLLIVSSL
jgi:hypothetical protein